MALARAVVSGTLATDPEKRFTPNNAAVTNFVLTVTPPQGMSSRQTAEAFDVKVTCWRGLADAAAQSLKKGDSVLVDGRLMVNAFQGSDGVQKRQYEIDASALNQISGSLEPITPLMAEAGGGASNAYRPAAPPAQAPMQNPGFSEPSYGATANPPNQMMQEDFLTEDDIPF
ncbi:MAG: single-stranded DNA-binding protein [Vampirovibrionales bacterium]|nr:single-stranded DNA-binding protein [Vampirovibrionales bacterium]